MFYFPRIQFRWPDFASGAVTSSWDDGTIHDRRLVEIFREHGFRGSFYLCSGTLNDQPGGSSRCISSLEIPALYQGFEVGAHAVTHPRLWFLGPDIVFAELLEDRRRLERMSGGLVTGFVFPFGRGASGDALIPLVRRAGFLYARRSSPAKAHEPPADFMNWDPSCHCGSDLAEQWEFYKSCREPGKLFNVWGHSYEFEERWGWAHLENFVRDAASVGSLWFATQREIYEYLTAWRGLRWSLDLGHVYNPYATAVCCEVDGNEVRIEGGQTAGL